MSKYKIYPVGDGFTINEVSGKYVANVCDEKLANAIVCLLEQPRLIANVSGGSLQGLMLDNRVADYLLPYLVDTDTEGCDLDDPDLFDVNLGSRTTVRVEAWECEHYNPTSDEVLAVEARLDPVKRLKPQVCQCEVTMGVLFDDGGWEKHTVVEKCPVSDEPSGSQRKEFWSVKAATGIRKFIFGSADYSTRKIADVILLKLGHSEIVDEDDTGEKHDPESRLVQESGSQGPG